MALNKDGFKGGERLTREELVELLAKKRNKPSVVVEEVKVEKPKRKTKKETDEE